MIKGLLSAIKRQKQRRDQNITLTIGLECSEHLGLKGDFYCTKGKKNYLQWISHVSSLTAPFCGLQLTANPRPILILRPAASNEEGDLTNRDWELDYPRPCLLVRTVIHLKE